MKIEKVSSTRPINFERRELIKAISAFSILSGLGMMPQPSDAFLGILLRFMVRGIARRGISRGISRGFTRVPRRSISSSASRSITSGRYSRSYPSSRGTKALNANKLNRSQKAAAGAGSIGFTDLALAGIDLASLASDISPEIRYSQPEIVLQTSNDIHIQIHGKNPFDYVQGGVLNIGLFDEEYLEGQDGFSSQIVLGSTVLMPGHELDGNKQVSLSNILRRNKYYAVPFISDFSSGEILDIDFEPEARVIQIS